MACQLSGSVALWLRSCEGHSIEADPKRLADHSDFFRNLLSPNFSEGRDLAQDGTVTIGLPCSSKVIQVVIDFCCRATPPPIDETLIELLRMANFLIADPLKNTMAANLASKNCLDLHSWDLLMREHFDVFSATILNMKKREARELLTRLDILPLSIDSQRAKQGDKDFQLFIIGLINCEYLSFSELCINHEPPELFGLEVCQSIQVLDLKTTRMDNNHIGSVVQMCPNIVKLLLPPSISDTGLACLQDHLKLEHLDISKCTRLASSCLEDLRHTPYLRSLNIAECHNLGLRALAALASTPNLGKLVMSSCQRLDRSVLPPIHQSKLEIEIVDCS